MLRPALWPPAESVSAALVCRRNEWSRRVRLGRSKTKSPRYAGMHRKTDASFVAPVCCKAANLAPLQAQVIIGAC